MSLPVALVLGAIFGSGLMLIVLGIRGVDAKAESAERSSQGVMQWLRRFENLELRLAAAVFAAFAVWYLSRWPIGILLAIGGGLAGPSLAGAKRRRQAAMAKVEAVAAWAEQLRDIIGTSSGLQEAIAASSRVAPMAIRAEVRQFAVDQRRENFGVAARRFAAAVADPAADQVAVALMLAAERRGQSLALVLDDVAAAAREESTMMDRTETARARSYTEALAVTSIVLIMFAGMLLFNRSYLSAFDTMVGQAVLGAVGVGWAFAIASLIGLAKIDRPDRLLTLDGADSSAGNR